MDESWMKLIVINQSHFISSSLKTVVVLKVPEILNDAAPSMLSAKDICDKLPMQNKDYSSVSVAYLGRIMRALAMFGVFEESISDGEHKFGLNAISLHLVMQGNDESMAPSMLFFKKNYAAVWDSLPQTILEGSEPSKKAHNGKSLWELDPQVSKMFNIVMASYTKRTMRLALESYKGFQDAKVIVDVGGGLGASLEIITAKYPHIQGINFDLPHVIQQAPKLPGVENVEGDMFVSVPSGDIILLKWILHDWDDTKAIEILKTCQKSLPSTGKVVIIDTIMPEVPGDGAEYSLCDQNAVLYDLAMLITNPGAKERTKVELQHIAKLAGFPSLSILAKVDSASIIELHMK